MNVLPFLSMAGTQIWKPLSFDNPYDDNSLYHNGTMTWKYSGSLDDHQPRVLPLELLDERGESSIVFKPWYTEHLCYSHLLLHLLMKLGDTAFSEKFWGVTPKNLAPSLLLYPTSPSPMILWATQYPFNITYFLANQSASKACLWHSKQTEDIKRDKSTMSLSCPVHKEKFDTHHGQVPSEFLYIRLSDPTELPFLTLSFKPIWPLQLFIHSKNFYGVISMHQTPGYRGK